MDSKKDDCKEPDSFDWITIDQQLQRMSNRLTELKDDMAKMVVDITLQTNVEYVRQVYDAELEQQTTAQQIRQIDDFSTES